MWLVEQYGDVKQQLILTAIAIFFGWTQCDQVIYPFGVCPTIYFNGNSSISPGAAVGHLRAVFMTSYGLLERGNITFTVKLSSAVSLAAIEYSNPLNQTSKTDTINATFVTTGKPAYFMVLRQEYPGGPMVEYEGYFLLMEKDYGAIYLCRNVNQTARKEEIIAFTTTHEAHPTSDRLSRLKNSLTPLGISFHYLQVVQSGQNFCYNIE